MSEVPGLAVIVLADILPRHLKTQDTDGHLFLAVAVEKNCERLVYFFLSECVPFEKKSTMI